VGGVRGFKQRKENTMKTFTRVLAVASIAILMLAACTSETSPSPSTSSAPPSAAASALEPPADNASVQEKLDWLAGSGLTGDDRRAFLIEQAAGDGPVVLYGSLNEELMLDWQNRLTAEFPELDVQVLRLQEGFERIRAESEAGQPVASVHDADPQGMALFLTEGDFLASYHSPELEGLTLAPGVEHPDGVYTVHSAQPMVAVYNTTLLTEDQMPDTLAELADTDIEWGRSRFGARWIAAIYAAVGETEALRLVDAFAAQQPTVFDSNSGMREAVIAGQIPFGVDTQLSGIVNAKAEGAPIEFHIIEPAFTDVGQVAILNDAPNPYGAVLLYDWILAADGGQLNFVGDTLGVRSDMDYELEGFADFVTEAVGYTPELLINSSQYDQIWEDKFIR
jgi:ABC-type Fe3+ transport system substrate-binding protein